MTTYFSLILSAVGVAIVANTILQASFREQQVPRHQGPPFRSRGILPVLLGAFITLCGGGLFVFARLP